MRLARDERGQTVVLVTVMLAALIGMAALVLDVGSWFRAKRDLQATADAAALAGAQALPEEPGSASSLAITYGSANGGGVAGENVTFESQVSANDTIVVRAQRPSDSFFSRIFGVGPQNVGANAKARAGLPAEALYVAPIAVYVGHPQIGNFGTATELNLLNLKKEDTWNAPGSFGLINLDGDDTGSVGSSTLASWVTSGFDQNMPLGDYFAVPSAKFNDSQFREALSGRLGSDLLFPVYDSLAGPGSNAVFNIIGWVGFNVTDFEANGNTASVHGWFTRYIAQGLQATTSGNPDFGTRVIQLVG